MHHLFRSIPVFLLFAAQAVAAFDCQILNAFPAQIDRPGKYCLDQSHELALGAGDAAILILANDVELDLRGHTLRNPAFEGGSCNAEWLGEPSIGVHVFEARNVLVHNGALRCFDTGVQLSQSRCGDCNQGNQVRNMRIHQSGFAGLFAEGDFGIYADNHIVDTGAREDRDGRGIYVSGDGNTIRNNDVQLVRNAGAGIATGNGNNNLVVENRVQNARIGFYLFLGSEVRYRDNLTAATQQPYAGTATDLGNND
jgi:nitrous oxidase accessory protein NosD